MTVSTRAAAKGASSATRVKAAGKENAEPKAPGSRDKAPGSRPSRVKRLVKSFSDDDQKCENKDAATAELVDRVARVGVQVLPVSVGELKGSLRQLKTSTIVDSKKPTKPNESDELNDLACLGIAGTTPGGRRWRARLKPAKSP